ncbi:MAG: hypothetical protein DWQ31_06725 [Planctomycetota bacterium]|nr:MAG: hypothetical protein DWQ31_06725 [Planctomycetota bacterium]REJ90330.1 MAG: hypothetical protein DWQ35_16780 [Planctomycetota bacterium]
MVFDIIANTIAGLALIFSFIAWRYSRSVHRESTARHTAEKHTEVRKEFDVFQYLFRRLEELNDWSANPLDLSSNPHLNEQVQRTYGDVRELKTDLFDVGDRLFNLKDPTIEQLESLRPEIHILTQRARELLRHSEQNETDIQAHLAAQPQPHTTTARRPDA